jgi:hypothetical protein
MEVASLPTSFLRRFVCGWIAGDSFSHQISGFISSSSAKQGYESSGICPET